MKKSFRKSLAAVLALLIMLSCFSVQSFALFDKISDVKIKNLEAFSYKQIKEEYEFLEEMGGAETDEDYYYYLACEADVTISTGEVIKVENLIGVSKDEKRSVEVSAYVDIRECKKAYKSGEMKVPVHITVTLYSSIGIKLDEKVTEKKASFTEKLVKKLSLSSGKIAVYSLDYGYLAADISGLTFDIVYGDGTKKKAKVKKAVSETMITYYTLDGEEIVVIPDYTVNKNGKLYASVFFCDYELRKAVKVKEFPIKSIKINKVTFDDSFKEKKLTCTITKTDGKTYKKTYEFGEPLMDLESLGMTIYEGFEFEGFSVSVSVLSSESEEYPPQQFKEVVVSLESVVDDSKKYDGPKEEATAIGELIFKIRKFIEEIMLNLYLI